MKNANAAIISTLREMAQPMTRADLAALLPEIVSSELHRGLYKLADEGQVTITSGPNPLPMGKRTVQFFEWAANPTKVNGAKHTPKRRLNPLVIDRAMDELRKTITELSAWKAEALRRYPDLAVSPLVLQARKIAAARAGPDHRLEILEGRKDDCPMMLAVLDALGAN